MNFENPGPATITTSSLFKEDKNSRSLKSREEFSFLEREIRKKVVKITQNHVGCGIEGYIPSSLEEVLVSFVDNIFAGSELMGINWCVARYNRELSSEYGQKVLNQVEFLQKAGFRLEFLY